MGADAIAYAAVTTGTVCILDAFIGGRRPAEIASTDIAAGTVCVRGADRRLWRSTRTPLADQMSTFAPSMSLATTQVGGVASRPALQSEAWVQSRVASLEQTLVGFSSEFATSVYDP